jgi:membrane fusion protein, multidrug efflux system
MNSVVEENPADHETPERTPERTPAKPSQRRWWLLVLVIALIALAWYIFAGRKADKQAAKPAPPPAPVLAQPAKKGDVGIYLNGLGTVTALNTVTVRSRVDGQLMEVRFREGQTVRQGDLLAVIDPRPFEVQLAQAEGQLAKDVALLKNAELDLQRYKQLWAQDSIPRQQLDTQESLVRQYEGSVKIDQGQIAAARLQITYCRITAPVSGRVGLRQVDQGNIIHASDANGLVVLTQLQPATVLFPIPEDSLPPVLSKLRAGAKLPVEAYDREQKQKLANGSLLTLDNQIDPATGTVRLKAVFPNLNNELFPNQFVNAKLLLEIKRQMILVPTSAIQRGPQGTFVYLVRPDRTVTVRPVTVGATQGDDTSVSAGLAEGEQVVVEGAERLREGSKVSIRQPGGGAGGPGGASRGGQGGMSGQGKRGQAPISGSQTVPVPEGAPGVQSGMPPRGSRGGAVSPEGNRMNGGGPPSSYSR